MTRNVRTLIIVAAVVVLAVVAATLGYALTRGDEKHMPKLPGRIAVQDGCGLKHFWIDGTDVRSTCLTNVFDEVSLAWNGSKLAWDTKTPSSLLFSGPDGTNPSNVPLPPGYNVAPSLAPDGKKLAFLHSPQDDGKYDIWVGSLTRPDSQQITTTRNVSDVAWSPQGDWIAYVQNWSEDTLEGQISLIRPNGDEAHTVLDGDAPDWSPDGKQLVYVHKGGIWTVHTDGSDNRMLVANAHSPAWSRDGLHIAFMRADKCGKAVCKEHVFTVWNSGADPRQVGPVFPEERRVLWLPDPNE